MADIQKVTGTVATPVVDYTKQATEYLTSMGLKLPEKYKKTFLELCANFGLNPFKREIYAVGYGDNFNIITGYEVYLKRAERCKQLDGWHCEFEGDLVTPYSGKAVCTIYRKDWSKPFVHEVYYSEVVQTKTDKQTGVTSPTAIWAKMPVFMTKKVAIAQAFRMAFPDEFSGMPYIADEMPEPEIQEATVINTKKPTPPAQPAEPTKAEKVEFHELLEQTKFDEASKKMQSLQKKYPAHDFSKCIDYAKKLKASYKEFSEMLQNGLLEKAEKLISNLQKENSGTSFAVWTDKLNDAAVKFAEQEQTNENSENV